jgi:hypothetical protein
VYSGFTLMPSGVTQLRALTSPPGADLAAAFIQASRFAGAKGESGWRSGCVMGEVSRECVVGLDRHFIVFIIIDKEFV